MKDFRTTIVLIVFFFAGLLSLWWIEYRGVPTEDQRRQRLGRVLPELLDTPESSITRLEIRRDGEPLRFERRGRDRWQMTRPLDVAADPMPLENLARNLKDLRPSADSGRITGSGESFGLAPPSASISVWAAPLGSSDPEPPPLATLEVGKTIGDQCYVRPTGSQAIDVVERRLLGALDRPAVEYRQPLLLPVPTFQVSSLVVRRDAFNLRVERGQGGRWRVTAPITAPANGAKIESTLAALSSIRAVDGAKGFIADNVTDFAPYGLERPSASIELSTSADPDSPLILHIGKAAPDHPNRLYVRRGDQDDVLLVSDAFLSEIPRTTTAFRAQNVTDINPSAVRDIQIEAGKTTFKLRRVRDGWSLTAPRSERADNAVVQLLLKQLDALQASEFLEPARVLEPGLDPPAMLLKLWQGGPGEVRPRASGPGSTGSATAEPPSVPPDLNLRIGRHDVLKKTVYGRLDGDDMILALPDSLLEVLPRNSFAFRDRGVLSLSPASVTRLALERQGTTTILEPDATATNPNQWRMVAPVRARPTSGRSPNFWPFCPTSVLKTSWARTQRIPRRSAWISPPFRLLGRLTRREDEAPSGTPTNRRLRPCQAADSGSAKPSPESQEPFMPRSTEHLTSSASVPERSCRCLLSSMKRRSLRSLPTRSAA